MYTYKLHQTVIWRNYRIYFKFVFQSILCNPGAEVILIAYTNTISDLLNGKPLSQAFDFMKYDAVALGNHEFDWGLENVVDADATMMDYIG